MILKTSCEKCIFKTPIGCELEKEVYTENGHQYTEGFCGHRRTDKWNESLVERDKDFSWDKRFAYADGENKTVSLVVFMPNDNVDQLQLTLNNIHDEGGILKDIICCVNNPEPKNAKTILETLIASPTKTAWHLDSVKDVENWSVFTSMQYAFRLVKTSWFLPVISGDLVHPKTLEDVWSTLVQYRENPVAFYESEFNNFHVVASTPAFKAMGGHDDKLWFEKVKGFKNWKDVCKKIN